MNANEFKAKGKMKKGKRCGFLSSWVLRFGSLALSLFPFSFCLLPFVLSLSPCEAAAPVLKVLEPRGAQQGQVFTLKLKGEGLAAGAEISTSLPGSVTRLAPAQDLPVAESELPLLVQLNEQARVGLYPIRIRTDEGLSNVLLFSVGTFPEVVESESLLPDLMKKEFDRERNDTLATAQKVAVPVTINGTLRGPDRDSYRFTAKAGERLVLEVEARRAGSAIDPVIRVLDGGGRELASNNDAVGLGVDARVEVGFGKAGEYYAVVHDARFSEQEQNFYRLKIGAYSYAEGIFPLGWQRGGQVEVTLFGGNLKAPVKVKPELGVEKSRQFVPVGLPGGASLPFQLVVSDLPEVMEPDSPPSRGAQQARACVGCPAGKAPSSSERDIPRTPFEGGITNLPPSTIINGRISRPGEVDRYRLSVTPGQHWNFEIEAATLQTSQLLGLISVYNTVNGDRLASSDEKIPADPYLALTVPENVKEITVQVEDLLGRGGPNYAYRLQAVQEAPGFAIDLLDPHVNVPMNGTAAVEFRLLRRGYDRQVRIAIPDLPDDLVLNGGHVPADPPGVERSSLPNHFTLTAKEGAKPRSLSLDIWGEAISSETPIRRQARAAGMMVGVAGVNQKPFRAPWLGVSLPMAVVRSIPLSIEVPTRHVRLPQGSEFELNWKLVRTASMTLPIKVDRRPTVNIRQINFVKTPEETQSPDHGGVTIKTTLATPATTFDLVFDGMVQVDGKSERVVTAPAVTVEVVPLYSLKLVSQKLALFPGQKLELVGQVERESSFKGSVKLRFEGLPEHVTSKEVVIPENESQFRLWIEASGEAKPQEIPIRLASAALPSEKEETQPYSVPEIKLPLIISKLGTTQ
jgi:hypothetical protein